MTRRPQISFFLLGLVAVALMVVIAGTSLVGGQAQPANLRSTVTFSKTIASTNRYAIGMGISTYGATPLNSSVEQRAERTLDARFVRIPVGFRNGEVASSAAGSPDVDISALIERYLAWGYRVLVVIGGETNDFDVQPGDTTKIVTTLGYGPDLQYSAPNEPTGQGKSIQDDLAVSREILAEGRAVYPDFKIWGPVWAYYDPASIKAFIAGIGSGLAGIDFHQYAMGQTSISTSAALAQTDSLSTEVAATYNALKAAGSAAKVAVDELNWSWRYDDGPNGSADNRFFTAADTVWIASACGHVMDSGGSCLPYANQNGALGMTVEEGGPNPNNRQVSSPMPGYWGLAAWTGADRFPSMNGRFFAATRPNRNIEVFAVTNAAGGKNVVVVNKSTTVGSLSVRFHGIRHGSYRVWRTDPTKPYAAPTASKRASYSISINLILPAMSVSVAVLRPKS